MKYTVNVLKLGRFNTSKSVNKSSLSREIYSTQPENSNEKKMGLVRLTSFIICYFVFILFMKVSLFW